MAQLSQVYFYFKIESSSSLYADSSIHLISSHRSI